ncbi:D-alanyl-D-alanine carboxypeptidase [hydrothermal vent metagenome]|uniref:D-alanyl-D-alanine carboxypeptidase n=1 Tax=hydrothermal vent metagenome TaxID=652676 RepID=A0A3B0VBA2_9ZZZZ
MVGCSSIQKSIIELESKNEYNAGFYLFDPATNKVLIDYKSDRYFTPASNTKVYTLYAANTVLPDSMPAFKYIETDTALLIWGVADPSFLNPLLPQGKSYSFLASQKQIYLSESNFEGERFGAGWAWDDYNGNYSQERTGFPIYGNSVSFSIDSINHKLLIKPAIFKDSIQLHQGKKYTISRAEYANLFNVELGNCNDCEKLRPIYFSDKTLKRLLQDTLHLPVKIKHLPLPPSAQTFYSVPKDSVLKVMMQQSDNFMAEHLLLSVASVLTDTLSTSIAIREMSSKIESFVPQKLVWRDGSGLSRYNLVTPQNMVALWRQLYKEMGEERLFSLISVGGEKGTLTHWFKAETPYIYGKTGTLSNVFCLSGFLIAKSGKQLIFSYTNNNYPVPSSDIKKEMELILRDVYEKY